MPPFTSGTLDGNPMKLPNPVIAVDGTIVHQQLMMIGFEIDEEDVSFSFQIEPDDPRTKPQYLIVARWGTEHTLFPIFLFLLIHSPTF